MSMKVKATLIACILLMLCFISVTTVQSDIISQRNTQFELSTNKIQYNIKEPVNIIFTNTGKQPEICEYHATIITNILTGEIVYNNIWRIFFYPTINPGETWTWTWDQKYYKFYKTETGWKPNPNNGKQVPSGMYEANYHASTTLFIINENGCYPAPNALYNEFNGKTQQGVTATTYIDGEINAKFKEYYQLDLDKISNKIYNVKNIAIGWWNPWDATSIYIDYTTSDIELQYRILNKIKKYLEQRWYTKSVEYIDICPMP